MRHDAIYYRNKGRHSLGDDVKRLRRVLHLTAEKLGELSGTSETTVLRLEHGNNVGVVQVLAILEVLRAQLVIKVDPAKAEMIPVPADEGERGRE